MRIIEEDSKKSTVKFYGNDPFNPTSIFTGRLRGSAEENGLVELEIKPIIEMDFKIDENREDFFYVSSGVNIEIVDIDTQTHYELYNHCIFTVLKSATTDLPYCQFNPETKTFRAKFRLVKAGRVYKLELCKGE